MRAETASRLIEGDEAGAPTLLAALSDDATNPSFGSNGGDLGGSVTPRDWGTKTDDDGAGGSCSIGDGGDDSDSTCA